MSAPTMSLALHQRLQYVLCVTARAWGLNTRGPLTLALTAPQSDTEMEYLP